MNRHLCLLYLKDKLPENKYLEFFYRMGSALNIQESHLVQLSIMLSPHGLFPNGPISSEQLKPLKKIAAVANCTALCKKAMYKPYSIQEHACCLCVFSKRYQNARENEERNVLRYLLRKDISFQHIPFPESMFHSKVRLSKDYALGTQPIVPFYYLLYAFLSGADSQSFTLEELAQAFSLYLYQQVPELTAFQTDGVQQIKTQVRILLSSIYNIPTYSINDDVFQDSLTKLSYCYEYEPISFIQAVVSNPTSETSVPNNSSIDATAERKLGKKEQKKVQDTSEKKKQESNKEETAIEPILLTLPMLPSVSPSLLPDEADSSQELEKELEQSLANQVLAFESSPFPSQTTKENAIDSTFFARIHRVTRKNIYLFTHSMQRSYNISIEPFCYEKRDGLLFYTSYDKTFFFLEPTLFSKQLLQFLLTDQEISYFTTHYIEVMSQLTSYQLEHFPLQEICVLFCLTESFNGSSPIVISEQLFTDITDVPKPNTYFEYMPYYRMIFETLYMATEEKELLTSYYQILTLYRILSKHYNLSILSKNLTHSFTEIGFLNYKFHYQFHYPIHMPGILYRITIPDLDMNTSIQPGSFLMTILLLLEQQHYHFRIKVKLLTLEEHSICCFFLGTKQASSYWYDSYLSALQNSYEQQFHKPLKSETLCIEYLSACAVHLL